MQDTVRRLTVGLPAAIGELQPGFMVIDPFDFDALPGVIDKHGDRMDHSPPDSIPRDCGVTRRRKLENYGRMHFTFKQRWLGPRVRAVPPDQQQPV